MSDDLLQAVQDYVEENIGSFHEKRLATVRNRNLDDVLKRKNPYLFRAKNQTVIQLVYGIMDAFLSSQEETLFGDFLEGVATFVANTVFDARKPSVDELRGIDLVLGKQDKTYVVEIKSGPNWGNYSQVQRMLTHFKEAAEILQPQFSAQGIVAVNGCMYGKDRKPHKTGRLKAAGRPDEVVPYWKLCGQDFWYFISNNKELYTDIIQPLGYRSKQRNGEFLEAYDNFINNLVYEFLSKYRNPDGSVAWEQLTRFVSKSDAPETVENLESGR